MELTNEFRVPVVPDVAFATMLDIQKVAICLPGAEITGNEGDRYQGEVAIRLGPVSIRYAGEIEVLERNDAARTAVLSARGREAGASGSVSARIRLEVSGTEAAHVTVHTDLDVRGRAAQFGRGILDSVARRMISQFAENLENMLAATTAQPMSAGQRTGTEDTARESRSVADIRTGRGFPRLGSSVLGISLRDVGLGALIGAGLAFVIRRRQLSAHRLERIVVIHHLPAQLCPSDAR